MARRYQGLREWLEIADGLGELKRVDNCDWDEEIGAVTELSCRLSNPPAHLFDRIRGSIPGFRVLTCALSTARRLAATLRLDAATTPELVEALRHGRIAQWEKSEPGTRPRQVSDGPIFENVLEGEKVDLSVFLKQKDLKDVWLATVKKGPTNQSFQTCPLRLSVQS